MLVQCSLCYRVLKSGDEIAGQCSAPGCGQPLCRTCCQAGRRRCASHQPAEHERLLEAQAAFVCGEIAHLTTALAARQLEQTWLARFESRLLSTAFFYHPGAGEMLDILNWARFHERDDEKLKLMQLLNVGYLDRTTQATLPRNALSRYFIPAGRLGRGRPSAALLVEARFAGRLEQYVASGFDTRPAGLQDLLVLLAALEKLAGDRNATIIAGLGSPTGWDEHAAAHIIDDRGRAYHHPQVLPFLVDLESGAVLANRLDERLSQFGFGELFKLPLESEEAAALAREIEDALAGREGLPVVELARLLDRPLTLALSASRVLERDGRFRIVQEAGGPLLMRARR